VAAEMVEAGSTGAGFNAVKAYAEYRSADKKKAVEELLELIQADPEDDVVQVVGATVLCLEDRTDEALDLLSKHEHNLEAYSVRQVLLADFRVGIIIQIRLAQHNHEAAEKELNAAKSWAQERYLLVIVTTLILGLVIPLERRRRVARGILHLRRTCSIIHCYCQVTPRPSSFRSPTWQITGSRIFAQAGS